MNTLTLEEALDILEINNVDTLTESDIDKYKRKAFVRWHPDKVEHTGDKNKIELYNAKSKLIEPAVIIIKKYLKGEYDPNQKFDDTNATYNYQDPIEVLRKNATMMQEELKKSMPIVKEKAYMKTEEDVVYSEGHKVSELLDADLKDDVTLESTMLWFVVTTFCIILGLIFSLACIFKKDLADSILNEIILFILFFHTFVCILKVIPLSRFWLPNWIVVFISWYSDTITNLLPYDSGFWNFISGVGMVVGYIFKYIVVFPLFAIAKLIVGDKVIRRVVKKTTYYANLADWYIEKLITTKQEKLEDEQIFHLAHAYNTLTNISK